MAHIAGKYQLVENKNFYELLIGAGISEEHAKAGNEIKGTLDVSVDGKKIRMANSSPEYVTELVLDQEVEEKMPGRVLKSTTTQNGNILSVSSKTPEGAPGGSRTLTFSEKGLEVVITSPMSGKTLTATRIYKRI